MIAEVLQVGQKLTRQTLKMDTRARRGRAYQDLVADLFLELLDGHFRFLLGTNMSQNNGDCLFLVTIVVAQDLIDWLH